MYRKLANMDIDNKRIILRVDYNVPIKDGIIMDDNKIIASLETINYLLSHNCSIIILSHLGKIKKEEDKSKNTLAPVAKKLAELLNRPVTFCPETRSTKLEQIAQNLQPQDIIMLENTRFEDLPNKLESNNDPQLASYWASLADVFVMDAFGSAHRAHASTNGIAKFIPSCIGLLIEKELTLLDKYLLNPSRPFTVIMGGAKIEDKLSLIKSLLPKCDYLLLTGCLANTCLKALKLNIGASLASEDETILNEVYNLLMQYKRKIMLPLDVIVGNTYDKNYVEYKYLTEINQDDQIFDIGNKTIEKFQTAINVSKTIFVNGTAGLYENEKYANGTKALFNIISKSSANTIIGGGDSVSAAINLGYKDKMTYLSTGGGATLEYIANHQLEALEIFKESDNNEILNM